jgi:hypothetical protein
MHRRPPQEQVFAHAQLDGHVLALAFFLTKLIRVQMGFAGSAQVGVTFSARSETRTSARAESVICVTREYIERRDIESEKKRQIL